MIHLSVTGLPEPWNMGLSCTGRPEPWNMTVTGASRALEYTSVMHGASRALEYDRHGGVQSHGIWVCHARGRPEPWNMGLSCTGASRALEYVMHGGVQSLGISVYETWRSVVKPRACDGWQPPRDRAEDAGLHTHIHTP